MVVRCLSELLFIYISLCTFQRLVQHTKFWFHICSGTLGLNLLLVELFNFFFYFFKILLLFISHFLGLVMLFLYFLQLGRHFAQLLHLVLSRCIVVWWIKKGCSFDILGTAVIDLELLLQNLSASWILLLFTFLENNKNYQSVQLKQSSSNY
jgi:hypothetical protein